tara:strand:+ start:12506 stop:13204 length:699 start_codon:yes stop_codon:yes gene_type:complete
MNQISVIIPAYEEGHGIELALDSVRRTLPSAEIIVSDGSQDSMTREACEKKGVQYLVPSRHHRSSAMNAGAKHAKGNLLLFLHADTLLPKSVSKLETLDLEKFGYGGFYKSFSPNGLMLQLHAFVVNCWKLELQKEFLGDNTIFVRKDIFEAVNGFGDLALFEDLDLSRRLRTHCQSNGLRPAIFRTPIVTSSRRFKKLGVISTIVFMQRCRAWYASGIPTAEIARRYAQLQ